MSTFISALKALTTIVVSAAIIDGMIVALFWLVGHVF